MRFGLLGPLELRTGGTLVPIAGAKQRALLALLLLHANEAVPRDVLVDALWPERPPGDAQHSLDHQVSRLRKVLDSPDRLVTRSGGYLLRVEPGELDSHLFAEELRRAREERAAGHSGEALAAVDRALGLWRGSALADLAGEEFARVEADRLEELRLSALEERFDIRLDLGDHREVVAELEGLVARHPLREHLRAQLMLALYRSERQAHALAVYGDGRRLLVDELGLEPGPELRALEQAILRHDPSLSPVSPAQVAPRGRRVAVVVVLSVATAAAIVALLLTVGGASRSSAGGQTPTSGVAFLSERTGKLIGRSDGLVAPLRSVFYDGALWNLSLTGVVSKIDPQTGEITNTVSTVPLPCGLAAGEQALWISDCSSPSVVRVDPTHTLVVGRFRLPVARPELVDATQDVAVGAGSIWVGQGTDNPSYVWRIDPATGRIIRRYLIPDGGAEALTFGDGALWVGGGVIGRVTRIDPDTNAVTAPARDLGRWLCCIAAGGGYVWAAVNPGGTVWKLTAHGDVVSSTKLGGSVEELRYSDGAVWAATGQVGTLVRLDPTTDAVRPYVVGHEVVGVAEHSGALAASVQSSGRDVTAGLTGRIAVVALAQDDLDATSTDPLGTQFAFNPVQVQFHYATCAKLFNYPDAGGVNGERLVPEVATAMPTPTNGGRTYTFHIRSNFGFSPPSRERVTAASFRHAVERFLSPAGGNYDPLSILGDIVGAKAYATGSASHVTGITAAGDTLVIRLQHPAGDLAARLSLPAFCAVPAELPTIPHGLPYPIPTAGPYYLADRSSNVLVLKPNPNYHGSRPRKLDAIVYRIGIEPGTAIAGVARGTFDYLASQDPLLAPATLAAHSAGERYHLVPNNWTQRLALNTARPAFADESVRRAVGYAIDRTRLSRALSNGDFQLPTSRLLPPNLADHTPFPFPVQRNVSRARQLMHDRHLTVVLAAAADETGTLFEPQVAQTLRAELAKIGIALAVVPLKQTLSASQRDVVLRSADLAVTGGNADDARDPVRYLLHLPYLPRSYRAQLDRINLLPSPRRETAAAELAARLERQALYLGYANAATAVVVSRRLGCRIDHPEYPPLDLAALCAPRR